MPLRFGQHVLDPEARCLVRQGTVLPLPPKAFDLLRLLIERRPAVVSHAEIHDCLWTGTAVAYTSLPRVVAELRKVLGDAASDPRYIRTVHRRGYAFCGSAVPDNPAPEARADSPRALSWGTRVIPLAPGAHTIGRRRESSVRIDALNVSRCHAELVVDPQGSRLRDVGSKNGTFLNGRRIEGEVGLADGDRIGIGAAALVYHDGDVDPSTLSD